jgi:hypothetical protein
VIELKVNAFKDIFFDRPAVVRAVEDANRKALFKAAMTVRKIAQRSMRYRKYVPGGQGAAPGRPPFARRGRGPGRDALVRKLLYGGYDTSTMTSVAGPAKADRATGAPRNLEFGGPIRTKDRRRRRVVGGGGEVRVVSGSVSLGRDPTGRFKGVGSRGKEVPGVPGVRVVYAKLRTQAQADRATRINAEIYGEPKVLQMAPRPFMRPALEKYAPEMPQAWARSVNGG